jgi:hypothetical protein
VPVRENWPFVPHGEAASAPEAPPIGAAEIAASAASPARTTSERRPLASLPLFP